MRTFFQSRSREGLTRPAQPSRTGSQGLAASYDSRADLDFGVTVSELSELEARALCAREGIAFFWPMRETAVGR